MKMGDLFLLKPSSNGRPPILGFDEWSDDCFKIRNAPFNTNGMGGMGFRTMFFKRPVDDLDYYIFLNILDMYEHGEIEVEWIQGYPMAMPLD